MTSPAPSNVELPKTCLPDWDVAELPEPPALSWRHWTRFIGPGIVMMGIQIGGGEWLYGPEITAKYGGGLLWIATLAILFQVFYNIECGRYALYCGEPVFTGFMRSRPGPMFWMGLILLINLGALIPGLSTHGAALIAALYLDRPPGAEDHHLVMMLAFALLFLIVLPLLVGGKVYRTLQGVMTAKVVIVLGFCLILGVTCVSPANWWNVFSGFFKFGTMPTITADGSEAAVNVFRHRITEGGWPLIAISNIALLGAFAGYAGGGGLSNATYGNFVRDKGWGMGKVVGAIPSAVGGRHVTLSHLGTVFAINSTNLARWKGWWRYIITDQVFIWAPGCFMGMALPALLSLEFSQFSQLRGQKLDWAQSLITADGMRHSPNFSAAVSEVLWVVTVFVGVMVMLPSQMAIIDDVTRRWTDILWSGVRRIRDTMSGNQVKRIYYIILATYVTWSFVCAFLFSKYGTPRLMTLVIANLNNVALGLTAFHVIWNNYRLLPPALRPRWYHCLGVLGCGVFYLGLAVLVFIEKQVPMIRELFSS
jgi:hypothetical protein